MSTRTNYKRLQEDLEYLKLKRCILHLDETLEIANTQHISHIERLLQLTDYEVDVKRENIIFLGFSGVEKTHLATSLGIESTQNRRSTYFIKCHDLIQNLRKVRDEECLEVRLKHYTRYQLLIIDEIGYLSI